MQIKAQSLQCVVFANFFNEFKENLSMSVFTVIGFWSDTDQRFATYVKAKNTTEAGAKCAEYHVDVTICGIIHGQHECVDTKSQLIHTATHNQ